jgi:hypothetical protein
VLREAVDRRVARAVARHGVLDAQLLQARDDLEDIEVAMLEEVEAPDDHEDVAAGELLRPRHDVHDAGMRAAGDQRDPVVAREDERLLHNLPAIAHLAGERRPLTDLHRLDDLDDVGAALARALPYLVGERLQHVGRDVAVDVEEPGESTGVVAVPV